MAKVKKELNTKLYAVIVFFVVAALLAGITTVTFRTKYNGFEVRIMFVATLDPLKVGKIVAFFQKAKRIVSGGAQRTCGYRQKPSECH